MAQFVPQREYMTVSNDIDIGSFGAVSCTIMILYDNNSRLVSHLDASTDLDIFKIQVKKYLLDKDPSDINILFTDSGDPNNFILREKLVKEIGLDNEIILIEGTQVVLTSKNKILTEFQPEKMFNLGNFDNKLGKELLNQSRKLKKKVDTFAKSRRGMDGVDEFGRQSLNNKGNSRLGYTYNYNLGKWVYNPDFSRQRIIEEKTNRFRSVPLNEMLVPINQRKAVFNEYKPTQKPKKKNIYIRPNNSNTIKPKKKKSYKKPKTFKKKTFNWGFKDTNHRQRGRTQKKKRKEGKKIICFIYSKKKIDFYFNLRFN